MSTASHSLCVESPPPPAKPWLLPIGVGFDDAVIQTTSFRTNSQLNFADLDAGAGTGANVMPRLTFGVRF